MKKIITIFVSMVLICSIKKVAYAAPADPDGWQTDPVINALMTVIYDQTGTMPNDVFKRNVWQFGYNPQDNYNVVMYKDNSQLFLYIGSSENVYLTDNDTKVVVGNTNYAIWNFSSQTNGNSYIYGPYTFTLGGQYSWLGSYLDAIEYEEGIDYSIPIPSATIAYAARMGEFESLDELSSWIYLNNPNVDLNNLYVEIQYKYYIPTKLGVTPNNFGDSQFNVIEYAQSSPYNSVSLVSKTKLTELTSVNNGQKYKTIIDENNTNWLTFFNDNRYNTEYYNSTTSDLLINAENYFAVNRYKAQRDMLPGAFNIMELFVRYYRIDGSQIKLGQWLHMKNDTTLDQQALNVSIPVLNPPVSTSVSDNIDLPDDNNSIGTGVWLPSTSTDINVTINMPEQNTLNYPTIVTYNHDIAFKQYAETARNIPSFFADVTNFATMAFSFIPPEVWAIVSMGLLLSIAVMVIKIL